ncbi:MAG: translocation/assembly module TamB [Bacteroidia bacterium]|nr:translocation/assembly module TamB [Bacteroidia bacterium]
MINTYTFQNYAVNKVTTWVNEKFKTQISIGEIRYDGWTFLSLRRVNFGDQYGDTTFYAGRVQFNLLGIDVDSTHFILNDLVLDEGLCKLTTYKNGTYSLSVVDLFLDPNDTTVSTSKTPFFLEFRNLECMDSRFMLVDSTGRFTEEGFDYNRIDIHHTNFRSKRFQIIDDSLAFDIKGLSCIERSGFQINRLNAYAIIAPSKIELSNLDLVTPNSHIKNYFSLNSKSYRDYSDFMNKVSFSIGLNQSDVDIKDIAYFAPSLNQYAYKARISGDAKGPLSNLKIKNVLAQMGEHTKFSGDITFRGLPEIEETFMDFKVNYASTIAPELEQVIAMPLPAELHDLGKLVYKGNFTGFYQDFVSYGSIETAFGSAQTDLNMKLNEQTNLSEYAGNFKLQNFQLGAYLKNNELGILDFETNVQGKGFDLEQIQTQFASKVNAITFHGYTYNGIDIDAQLNKKDLLANFSIQDTNISLETDVHINLANAFKHLVFSGTLKHANLRKLGFTPGDINLSTYFNMDYYYKDLNDQKGTFVMDDFQYEKLGYTYRVNQIKLETDNEAGLETMRLSSDFLKAKIWGSFNFTHLVDQLGYWALHFGKNYFGIKRPVNDYQQFEYDINLVNTNSISPLLFPGINLSNLNIEGKVSSKDAAFEMTGYLGNLSIHEWQLNQTTFKVEQVDSAHSSLLLGFNSFGKVDTLLIGDFALKADAHDNVLEMKYQVEDSLSLITGMFAQDLLFEPKGVWVDFKDSWVKAGNAKWNIAPGKSVFLNTQKVELEELTLSNQDQVILTDGYYDFRDNGKNISAKISKLNLNTINQFDKELGVTFGGLANAYMVYKNMGSRDVLIGNVNASNLALDKDTLGDFVLNIGYREMEEDLMIDFTSHHGKLKNLHGVGEYDISKRYLNFDIDFTDSKINAFQAFVKDYVKLYEGNARLNAKVSGPINKLSLDGQLVLDNVAMKVEYLQTNYKIPEARINLNDNSIMIVPFVMNDAFGKTAEVKGNVLHNNFSELKYNINIDNFKNFQVLQTNQKDNELFYGSAFASGKFSMKGSSSDLSMYIDAKSEKGTKIMINPFGVSNETGEEYINFVSRDTLAVYSTKGRGAAFGVGVFMKLDVNPNAEIQLVFDAKSDDRIKAIGSGKLKLDYLPNGNFTMEGIYELSEGEYRFSALNVVAKKFDLKPGSKIKWSGDPLTGRLDIQGIYRLKTSVSEIVNMSKSPDPNVRLPVECIINIKGIVEKPEFVFDLNFPDLQNNLTGATASELNAVVSNFRREPEMMNQQMLFLLISGSFVPITNANNNLSNTVGSQTVSDLLSKQAASLLGKAVPNIDLSVNLLNASDPTRSRTVLLSASKKFLDNRLEVQTSYAMDQTQTNLAANYSLKRNGNTKIKFFNKSGFDALYNRNVTTSGTGLYYRKEFNSFPELFKKQSTNSTE